MVMVYVLHMEYVNVSVLGQELIVRHVNVQVVLPLVKYLIPKIQPIRWQFAVDEVTVTPKPVYVHVIQVSQDRAVVKCFVTTTAMATVNV